MQNEYTLSYLEEMSDIINEDEKENIFATLRPALPGKPSIMVQKSKSSIKSTSPDKTKTGDKSKV